WTSTDQFIIEGNQATPGSEHRTTFIAADAGTTQVSASVGVGGSGRNGIFVRGTLVDQGENGFLISAATVAYVTYDSENQVWTVNIAGSDGGDYTVLASATLSGDPGAHTLSVTADGTTITATVGNVTATYNAE